MKRAPGFAHSAARSTCPRADTPRAARRKQLLVATGGRLDGPAGQRLENRDLGIKRENRVFHSARIHGSSEILVANAYV